MDDEYNMHIISMLVLEMCVYAIKYMRPQFDII